MTVRYFAAAEEVTGRSEEELVVAGGTIRDLRAALLARYGDAMGAVVRTGSFLVDGVVETDDAAPLAGRVDVLPPFAGG
nr:MoaD/ThiS family protein [Beutenbergia cavernae]